MLNILLEASESVHQYSQLDLGIGIVFLVFVCGVSYAFLRPFTRKNKDKTSDTTDKN